MKNLININYIYENIFEYENKFGAKCPINMNL